MTETASNFALEPTPTAFARASLRLLALLTAGVRLRVWKAITDVLRQREEQP